MTTPRLALAKEIIALAQSVPGIRSVEAVDAVPNYLHVDIGESNPYLLVLANAERMVAGVAEGERATILRRVLLSTLEQAADKDAGDDWSTAKNLLLRTTLIPAHHEARHPGDGFVGEEVLPGVAEVAALDAPITMTFASHAHCGRWAASPQEVLAAARQNVIEAPEPGRWKKLRNVPLWELHGADEYSAARLIQPGYLARHQPPGDGQLVFAMPTRELIIAGWLDDLKPHLAELSATNIQAWRSDERNAVSPVFYTVRRNRIQPLRRGPGAAGKALRIAEATLAKNEYSGQQDFGTPPPDCRWARLDVINQGYQDLQAPGTCTFWSGRSSNDLLPRADFVAVPDRHSHGPVFIVPWDHFTKLVALEQEATMPSRWRTAAALTAADHDALIARAVHTITEHTAPPAEPPTG